MSDHWMPDTRRDAALGAAKFDAATIKAWRAAEPRTTATLAEDRLAYGAFWRLTDQLLERLPKKAARDEMVQGAAQTLFERAREARERFLATHVEAVYAELTGSFARFVRLEDLVFAAAEAFPGLTPSRAQIAAEAELRQRDKEGREIDHGLFLAHVLGHERAGTHLCHAMLLPRPESEGLLANRLMTEGSLDLGAARLERHGPAVHVIAANPRYLNAEDATTLDLMEAAVDVAILDPASKIAVMRGGVVEHPKYRGRRLLGAGINLTHLYRGKIPFTWFLQRDLGYVHKIMRGVARPGQVPDDVHASGIEKPWIAAVEGFAIGGHCQVLLTMDYVLAANDAYMTLPARKEGIIPGAANLRLPRFVGDRLARQLIQYERKLLCDSAEGRLICDEIVAATEMDAAIDRTVAGLTGSGEVGAIGNRRAFRVAGEPLDLFRRYMATYAREQAYCHFSPALIANLERYWNAQNRAE